MADLGCTDPGRFGENSLVQYMLVTFYNLYLDGVKSLRRVLLH